MPSIRQWDWVHVKKKGSTVRPRAFPFKCPIYPNYNKVITVTLRTLRAPESLGPWDSCSLRPCWWAILAHYNTRKHRRKKKAINPDPHDLSWLSASENMSTQISFCCSMNKLQLKLMGTRRETTHSEALSTKETSQSRPALNHRARLQNIHHTPFTAPAAYETNVLTAADSCLAASLRTCLPCHAREKEHRHHFDCSSQPQHCRSTVCQAHSLLVSKISHSGQGETAEHSTATTHTHTGTQYSLQTHLLYCPDRPVNKHL